MATGPDRDLDPGLFGGLGARVWLVAAAASAVALAIAWSLMPPRLPRTVEMGTGPLGGHYAVFGEGLEEPFEKNGIDLRLVHTAGSMDNIRRLLAGELDVALVQSGNLSDEEVGRLESIAAVFFEPVLTVHRVEWTAENLIGARVGIGAPGSGTHALATTIARDQGLADGDPPGTRLVEIGEARAVEALRGGELDAAIFVTSLQVPWVRTLFADPELVVADMPFARAFTRHYRYLRRIVVPAGVIDLPELIPRQDVESIATTASLVIRPETHHGLIPLLIESCNELLLQGSLLADPGVFPSPHGVEAPLAPEALDYFDHGPSLFYRWFSFRWAFIATRLSILLIPLLTLLIPVLRFAGPAYRWSVERKVFRWYRVLRRLEEQLDASDPEARALARKHLDLVGEEIRATQVPARYGAQLFQLRQHHRLLLERADRTAPGETGQT